MALTMMQKRSDFASYLLSILQVHDSDFIVDTTERRELEQNVDRKSRVCVTGDPERYCIILDTGEANSFPSGFDAAGQLICQIGHTMEVRLFWQKDYSASQALFEACVYNAADDSKPGLLDTLRSSRYRTVGAETYSVGLPLEDALINIQRGSWDFGSIDQPEMSHYLQFSTTLIDV